MQRASTLYPAGAVAVAQQQRRWSHLRSPATVVLLLVALAEMVILAGLGGQAGKVGVLAAALLPLAAAAAVVNGRPARWAIPIALLLLIAGGAVIFRQAATPMFIAFAYPAVFASIAATAQPRRLFMSLLTLVVVACVATLLLDTFQQQVQYPGKKVIVFASAWATGEAKQPIFEAVIREFEQAYPEYKVVVRWDGRWVLSKNRPRLLTGKDIPDLIEGGKEGLRILVQENYALPLDPYLDEPSVQTGRPWREDWRSAILDLGRYDLKPLIDETGQEYEHPLQEKLVMASSINHMMLFFYNRTILRKLGVDQPPETWDEFLEICRMARAAGHQPIMLDAVYQDMLADSLLRAALPEGELRKTVLGLPGARPFTDEQYVRLFRLQRELADHHLMDGWRASTFPMAQQQFATGRGLFIFCGSWLPGELRTTAVDDPEVYELGVMNIPRFADDAPGTFVIDSSGWVVLRDAPQREGTIKLLQFLSDRWGGPIALEDGNPVAFARDPLPPELAEIEGELANMQRAGDEPVAAYAPMWRQYIWSQFHQDFFEAEPGEARYRTPEAFAAELQAATQRYQAEGGEAKWR